VAVELKPLIVIADDDRDVLNLLAHKIESWGYRAGIAQTKAELMAMISKERPALVLLDLQFGDLNGIELLQQLQATFPEMPVAMLTAHGSIDTAVSAMRWGAYDFLTKPPDFTRLQVMIGHATEKHTLQSQIQKLETLFADGNQTKRLQGDSPAIHRVNELLRSVAPTDATVLLQGESGTGKERAAQTLHDLSNRASGPFVPLNMAALPRELAESLLFGHEKGAFTGADRAQAGACELANKGTLFLDEIGEMEITLQAKLLRFLQERTVQRVGQPKAIPVDVRIVAATNRQLADQVRAGLFREDLFYRLHVVPIVLPPLRERGEDIISLALRFLARATIKYRKPSLTFTPQARAALLAYEWPGNVRQLENLMERLAILCPGPTINTADFASEFHSSLLKPLSGVSGGGTNSSGSDSELRIVDQLEKQAIIESLEKHRGNVRDAAQSLGLSQATIYRKLKRYQVNLDSFTN